jgi:tetratricopeptide (TPR) repeat protein
VKRQQYLLAGIGVLILLCLYFFGETVPRKEKNNQITKAGENKSGSKSIDIQDILRVAKTKLSPSRSEFVTRLENSVVRGDVKNQQLSATRELAAFWKDTVNEFLPAAYYAGEAAKLENSEKSLTFAARLFQDNLQNQDNQLIRTWMADRSRELFEAALNVNPNSDSSKIGLGSTFIFGGSASNPGEMMQGIQQILSVAKKDSLNMYAQYMLGIGGKVSGQLDKAVERFTNVVRHQPDNLEAILRLADACEQTGNKKEAVSWYLAAKKLISNPEIIAEIDKRIKLLQ